MCKLSFVCVVTLQDVVNECILSSELKCNKYPMLREYIGSNEHCAGTLSNGTHIKTFLKLFHRRKKSIQIWNNRIFGVNYPFKMTDICAHVPFRPHQNHSDVPVDHQERLMKHYVSVQTEYCDYVTLGSITAGCRCTAHLEYNEDRL